MKMKTPIPSRTLQLYAQLRGMNSGFDTMAPELFYEVMLFLEPKDIAVCMCVSKRWKLLLSTSYFWRNYLNSCFDFDDDNDDEDRLTGMLHELGSTWLYGWGTLPDLPGGELFEELPKRWKSGIVHPVGVDVRNQIDDHKAMYEALYQLQKLQDKVNEREIVYTGATQNRGECPVDMLMFRWDCNKLPSKDDIVELFRFNTRLQLNIRYERSDKNYAEVNNLGSMFKCRRHLPNSGSFYEEMTRLLDGFIKVHVDYAGRSQTFRPSPLMIVTQLSPGWCGGLLTGTW